MARPDEVKAIARLLEQTIPDMLRKRFKPKEMTRTRNWRSSSPGFDLERRLRIVSLSIWANTHTIPAANSKKTAVMERVMLCGA